jgi:hypothetical protein
MPGSLNWSSCEITPGLSLANIIRSSCQNRMPLIHFSGDLSRPVWPTRNRSGKRSDLDVHICGPKWPKKASARRMSSSLEGHMIVARHEVPAPKGQESLAQGLPWVNFPLALALKGRQGRRKSAPNLSAGSSAHSGPFRDERLFWLTQGKPWAMLFRPLWATDLGNVQTSDPGTSCLAHYQLVPPGQKPFAHSKKPRIKLALMGFTMG